MTPDELATRVEVLEERLAHLTGAVVVLLEAIADGTAKDVARELREIIEADLQE